MIADARAEWLEWRRQGIGASDIGALLGLSNFTSPWALWAEKTGLIPPSDDDAMSDAQLYGHLMEPVLAKVFNIETGLYVVGEQTWCKHPDYPWMRATVDGFAAESPNTLAYLDTPPFGADMDALLGVVEFKTDGRLAWEGDGPPPGYTAQCLWQMGTTGLRNGWIVVQFGNRKFKVYEVPWSQSDWDFMVRRATAFWNDHVLTGIAPEIDDSESTHDALAKVYKVLPGTALTADLELHALFDDLESTKATIKEDESHLSLVKNRIADRIREAEIVIDAGGTPLYTYRSQSRRGINADALREAHPEIADQFTTTSTFRVLRKSTTPKGTK